MQNALQNALPRIQDCCGARCLLCMLITHWVLEKTRIESIGRSIDRSALEGSNKPLSYRATRTAAVAHVFRYIANCFFVLVSAIYLAINRLIMLYWQTFMSPRTIIAILLHQNYRIHRKILFYWFWVLFILLFQLYVCVFLVCNLCYIYIQKFLYCVYPKNSYFFVI